MVVADAAASLGLGFGVTAKKISTGIVLMPRLCVIVTLSSLGFRAAQYLRF